MRRRETALVIMAKWPQPGRTKTRLCPPLQPEQAAELARCFLLDTLAAAAAAGMDCLLAYAPLEQRAAFRRLVGPRVGLIPTQMADLGAALTEAQRTALALGYRRVALVAADLPHLPPGRYRDAFAALTDADVVIGPSGDGGYYLIAAARPTPQLFQGIRWSTETVLACTLERVAAAGLCAAMIDACDDVDTAEDLPALVAALRQRPGAGHTLRLLEQLPFAQLLAGAEGR